jgi:hypothetical protein
MTALGYVQNCVPFQYTIIKGLGLNLTVGKNVEMLFSVSGALHTHVPGADHLLICILYHRIVATSGQFSHGLIDFYYI